MNRILLYLSILHFVSCTAPSSIPQSKLTNPIPADHSINSYLNILKGRRVGLLINHTAVVNKSSLLDTLLTLKVNVVKIFAPEHGFRGSEQAGDFIPDVKDSLTGIPIISLYGKKLKPYWYTYYFSLW